MIVKVQNLYSRICKMEVVPTDTQDTQLHIRVKQRDMWWMLYNVSHRKIDLMNAQRTHLHVWTYVLIKSFKTVYMYIISGIDMNIDEV